MKTTKFMAFIIAVLTAVLFSSTVQAQQKGAFVSFQGIEISTGHEEPGEAYGWMCYAKTTGALPGNLTLSMDYEGMKAPGTSSTVTGGAWTLPVYNEPNNGSQILHPETNQNRFVPRCGFRKRGSRRGRLGQNRTPARLNLKCSSEAALSPWLISRGTAVLYGTVSYDEKGTGTFDGTIYFEFQ